MSEQKTLFHTVNGNVVVKNYAFPDPPESKTSATTVKFTDSLKKQIQEFCFKHDMSVSEFLRDAGCFYHDFYAHSPKLVKYREAGAPEGYRVFTEPEMERKKLFSRYSRIFSFLRVVPLIECDDFYMYIRKEQEPGEHKDPDAPWLMEREKKAFRTVRNGEGLCSLLWLPNDSRYRHPTFAEFRRAYGKM